MPLSRAGMTRGIVTTAMTAAKVARIRRLQEGRGPVRKVVGIAAAGAEARALGAPVATPLRKPVRVPRAVV